LKAIQLKNGDNFAEKLQIFTLNLKMKH